MIDTNNSWEKIEVNACQVGILTYIFPKPLVLTPQAPVTMLWQMTKWMNKEQIDET